MTIALIENAILAALIFCVVLALLAGAIHRSPADHRLANAARRRLRAREARHAATSRPHPRASWSAHPDAS